MPVLVWFSLITHSFFFIDSWDRPPPSCGWAVWGCVPGWRCARGWGARRRGEGGGRKGGRWAFPVGCNIRKFIELSWIWRLENLNKVNSIKPYRSLKPARFFSMDSFPRKSGQTKKFKSWLQCKIYVTETRRKNIKGNNAIFFLIDHYV